MAEWLNAPVLKTGGPQGLGGSNPSPSANRRRHSVWGYAIISHMKHIGRLSLVAVFCMGAAAGGRISSCASVASPNGSLELAFETGPDGMFWSLTRKGKILVAQSRLGLSFALFKVRGRELGEMRIVERRARSSDTVWKSKIYRRGTVRDRYNELEVMLEEVAEPHRRLGYVFRAYDEGAAFRYVVPEQEGVGGFELLRERTEWRFPGKCRGWLTSYASEFNSNEQPFVLREIGDVSSDEFIGMPATVEVNGQHVALCEAALVNWAGFYFKTPKDGQQIGRAHV